jgi:predicted TIM-barrel fold metal-dependent hydrolase
MIIIDAQVHVWPPDRPDRRLGAGVGDRKPYGYEQLIADMDRAGVDRAILVPPSFDADRNDYALEGARRYPDRFAVMGRIALKTSAGKDALKQWREQPGMLGVRLTFHRDADRPWLTDGTADWFWPEAQRNDIPVMVHAPERLTEIGEVAARYPNLRIIVDHMGFARATMDDKASPAVERMNALARYPNVFVKVSALPCFSTEPYPFGNLREPLRRVIEAFGPRRAFWGSDITRVPTTCSYRQTVTHFTEELDFLSPGDLEWIMGRGLADCLRWPLAQPQPA